MREHSLALEDFFQIQIPFGAVVVSLAWHVIAACLFLSSTERPWLADALCFGSTGKVELAPVEMEKLFFLQPPPPAALGGEGMNNLMMKPPALSIQGVLCQQVFSVGWSLLIDHLCLCTIRPQLGSAVVGDLGLLDPRFVVEVVESILMGF
jgi:hypothetical protein